MLKYIGLYIFLCFLLNVPNHISAKNNFKSKSESPTIIFKENKGQISDQYFMPRPDVLFAGNAGDMVFHLRQNGISYQFYRVDEWAKVDENQTTKLRANSNKIPSKTTIGRLDINWLNINPNAQIVKQNQVPGETNFYSNVCKNGALGIKGYKNIEYQNLYNGIDLKWYEKNGNLKYDYIVSSGANYKDIKLELLGAESIYLNKNGELVIKSALGTLTEQAPLVTQEGRVLKSKWVITNTIISFDIEGIDDSKAFVIDPLIRSWGTFFGGSMPDETWYTTIDASGNVYATGDTQSLTNIATVGSHQVSYAFGTQDAFLAKFDSFGALIWCTYYGGDGSDYGNLCITDASGNVILSGSTTSTLSGVIATIGSHQQTCGGGWDGYLALFNSSGVRQWGTYYGGSGNEWVIGCSKDASGTIYLAGSSLSTNNISTPGCHQPSNAGGYDAFLAKFTNAGTRLWGTYYGGVSNDDGYSCSVDASGNIYLIGQTLSNNNISTPGCHQVIYGGTSGGYGDGYIAKFDASGNRLWCTYYGGSGSDWMFNCAIDASGDLYISGTTSTPSVGVISTPGSHQVNYGGGNYDAFLLKMNSNGIRQWCTFYGGTGLEDNNWCDVDANGNPYLTGSSNSTGSGVISTPCAYQQNYAGGQLDAYLVKFNSAGNRLWGTYYGGAGIEEWSTCSTDGIGNVYITGRTSSTSSLVFASAGCHQSAFGGNSFDGYIAKFDGCIPIAAPNTTDPSSLTVCYNKSTVLTTSLTCGINWFNTPVGGSSLLNGSMFTTPSLSSTTTYYIEESSCGNSSSRTAVTVTVLPTQTFVIAATQTAICNGSSATLTPLSVSNYTWQANSSLNITSPTMAIVNPASTQTYYISGDNGGCSGTGSIVIQVVPVPTLGISNPQNFLCAGKIIGLSATGANTYSWQPATGLSSQTGSMVTASPSSNITYTVFGSNVVGNLSCSSQQTMGVYIVPYANATISNSVTICLGSAAKLIAGGGSIYTWWPIENMDNPNASEVNVTSAATQVYTVNVSSNGLCSTTKTVLVQVNPVPTVDAGIDKSFNINEPIHIAAAGSGTISWTEGANIYCKNCPYTQVFPTSNTCYTARSINEFGCIATDQVCITVTKEHAMYIPSCFTPNHDGLNDEFKVFGDGISLINFTIYNRWGQVMYFSESEQPAWDGKYKGEDCPEGVYIYRFLYKTLAGDKFYKAGNITLIGN